MYKLLFGITMRILTQIHINENKKDKIVSIYNYMATLNITYNVFVKHICINKRG